MKSVTIDHNNTTYSVSLLQYDYSTMTAHVTNTETDRSTFIDIPVRVAPGFRWKCYAASVGCDSGTAADLVEFFEGGFGGDSYLRAVIRKVVFDNAKNRRRVEEMRPWA